MSRRQSGLTLVELLVALAIGLLVLAAATAIFASSSSAETAQAEEADAEEGGRYALEIIGRAVRQAGYADWSAGAPARKQPALAGLDARSLGKTSADITDPLASPVHGSDVLAVRFEGAGKPPNGDGSVLNCAGFAVPSHAEGWSIFYLGRAADGSGELRCKYRAKNGWSADAVVAGVDTFQVLYGLDTDEPADGTPNRYVNAGAIDALDQGIVLTSTGAEARKQELNERSWWNRVATVRYALLLRAARASSSADRTRVYDLFGAAYGDSNAASDPGSRLTEAELAGGQPPRHRWRFVATVALRVRP